MSFNLQESVIYYFIILLIIIITYINKLFKRYHEFAKCDYDFNSFYERLEISSTNELCNIVT